ncbi:flavin reductase family protein [Rubrimonas cliftonensis]|uniref:NADH-FMN oxidoreductase RutF, flavin reductase (DIM6/NTAB) family n=1 Tax=Rubrimonas cliftonensis TaxID=89524 RepID=A0A1H3VZK0_9RHOB|nr:flavin reductase family protein [Rubrimonas cliftonensis]SDZ80229.1 NADH-FMN oxidoreductase RutF, flavin reductase (DIM6/NTAB) family [Rubrimonas cliftonensis]
MGVARATSTAPEDGAMGDAGEGAGAPAGTLDGAMLRRALGGFATGVTVTTALGPDGRPAGFTANSFTSVSLEPPLVLVCLGRGAASYPVFAQADGFAVNVLSADQQEVARVFATRGADKFASVAWGPRETGAPVFRGVAAWFDCRMRERIDAGDHVIVIGEVIGFGRAAAAPLLYCGGRFAALDSGVRLSVVARAGDAILTREDGRGLRLPTAAAFGPADDPASLSGLIARWCEGAGRPTPLHSFDEPDGAHRVVYAVDADALRPSGPSWRATPVAGAADAMACPLEVEAVRAALSRAVRHRS